MKRRETKTMLKIEALMERLGSKAQDRVAAWVMSRWKVKPPSPPQRKDLVERFWSAKIASGVIALMHYDISVGDDVLAGVLGVTSARKLAAEILVAVEELDPEDTNDEQSQGVMNPELGVDEGGILGGSDGIFDVDPDDTQLSDAEMTAHVYGLIRMGLKEEVMNHLHNADRCESIIRGTGRQDLFGSRGEPPVFDPDVEGIYEILERLANDKSEFRRQFPSFEQTAINLAFADLRAAVWRFGTVRPGETVPGGITVSEVPTLVGRHREALTKIIRENTHECMLSRINPEERARYNDENDEFKSKLVDLWERLRIALGLAYNVDNR